MSIISDHAEYPNALLSTECAAGLIGDPNVVFAHVDLDGSSYAEGHVPGAVSWPWLTTFRDESTGHMIPEDRFLELLRDSGIERDSVVVIYGDHSNQFAAWAHWMLTMFGHPERYLIDGGLEKWSLEDRVLTDEGVLRGRSHYREAHFDEFTRAQIRDVIHAIKNPEQVHLIDARSEDEYMGRTEGPLCALCGHSRLGHIVGAKNVPWDLNLREDGTFKDYLDLFEVYSSRGIGETDSMIVYCAAGERSSLTWFALHQLLGFNVVMNYDGSFHEWGQVARPETIVGEAA